MNSPCIRLLHIALRCVLALAFLLLPLEKVHSQCGDPNAGSCCEVNETSHCSDVECCSIVCNIMPACCVWPWDENCAFLATHHCLAECGSCGSASTGECCTANSSPHCKNAPCCDSVCAADPFCCDAAGGGVWDQSCADLAWKHCPDLPGCSPPPLCPGEGGCCTANATPGCSNATCCNTVCDLDPHCCEVEWDECCAHLATQHCHSFVRCPLWPPPQSGSCVGFCNGPSPDGCWCDNACMSLGDCCPDYCPECLSLGNCDNIPPLPPTHSCKNNCGGAALSGCWCDEACCSFGDCCEDKGKHCVGCLFGLGPGSQWDSCTGTPCGGPTGGGCWCDELCGPFNDCCSDVCNWCPDLNICIPPNPADLTGSGGVGVPDLLLLLQNWGECEYDRCFVMEDCPADFNHDQSVGVPDLLFLLQNWGSP